MLKGILHSDTIDKLVEEETDLALHTKLCAQRYEQINEKFAHMDTRLDTIETTLVEIKDIINQDQRATLKQYLAWAGTIIMSLIGITGWLVTHYVLK